MLLPRIRLRRGPSFLLADRSSASRNPSHPLRVAKPTETMECCTTRCSPLVSSFVCPSPKWTSRRTTRPRDRVSMALPVPPRMPNDPFLSNQAFTASAHQTKPHSDDTPPLLGLMADITPRLMAGPAQVERASYNEHRPRRPPPDLPSLLLNSRIVFIGMPLVPAVTELVIAEFLYLQWLDPSQPTYVYINSTGTSREDGETVALETEGFAIYDTMMQMKNEIHTVAFGAAVGQACLLLAAGKKGKRFMLPHAQVMLQQPRLPPTGQMPAIDVHIRAKELIHNRDTFVKLLAKHTGNPFETVAKAMERPLYMFPREAVEFGVADKVLSKRDKYGEELKALSRGGRSSKGLSKSFRRDKYGEELQALSRGRKIKQGIMQKFQEMRLEKAWGDNAEHVLDMIHLLLEIFQTPEPLTLEMFLVGNPMVFNVVVHSPHGYFGHEANGLGMLDKTMVDRSYGHIMATVPN